MHWFIDKSFGHSDNSMNAIHVGDSLSIAKKWKRE